MKVAPKLLSEHTPITQTLPSPIYSNTYFGEDSVLANAQALLLSRWIFLPRLTPAPQALMHSTRPNWHEPVPGHVSAVFSSDDRYSINYVGNIVW